MCLKIGFCSVVDWYRNLAWTVVNIFRSWLNETLYESHLSTTLNHQYIKRVYFIKLHV